MVILALAGPGHGTSSTGRLRAPPLHHRWRIRRPAPPWRGRRRVKVRQPRPTLSDRDAPPPSPHGGGGVAPDRGAPRSSRRRLPLHRVRARRSARSPASTAAFRVGRTTDHRRSTAAYDPGPRLFGLSVRALVRGNAVTHTAAGLRHRPKCLMSTSKPHTRAAGTRATPTHTSHTRHRARARARAQPRQYTGTPASSEAGGGGARSARACGWPRAGGAPGRGLRRAGLGSGGLGGLTKACPCAYASSAAPWRARPGGGARCRCAMHKAQNPWTSATRGAQR